jgi:Tol biopolymer transport system component
VDGSRLLVWLTRGGARDIFLLSPDGSERAQLTDTAGDEGPGSFSPDGSLIAFSYSTAGGQRDIWVMRADGSQRRQLTDDIADDWIVLPFWSPDGTQILYQRGRRGVYYVVGLDGAEPRKLFGAPSVVPQ